MCVCVGSWAVCCGNKRIRAQCAHCYRWRIFQASGHSPQVGKSFQPTQTLCVFAARTAAVAPVWSGCTTQCETDRHRGKWRPSTVPKTAREGLNHTVVRLYTPRDTPTLPLRTRLQFIRQAFPASAEKQTDPSLLLPADLCLSPPPSPSSHSVMSESLFSGHNNFVLFWPCCV